VTASIAYVLSSALWSLGGLVVGYVLGKVAGRRQALVIIEAEQGKEAAIVAPATRTDIGIGVLVIVMAVVSVAVTAVSTARQSAQVDCQAKFNQAFSSALTERVEAAAQERAAMRQLLTAALAGDRVNGRNYTVAYLDQLKAADAKRDANPIPEHPAC
jgi:hypothetical protein